jgi:2-polyprenyl-3-methyl-5-hydroxy-6-metoxy-1,4-benzoquinol methylase
MGGHETAPRERRALVPTSPWWGEHRSRYHLAATRVRGATVLDVGCGAGIGCEILADAGARLVVGADLRLCRAAPRVRQDEVAFLTASETALPFRDGAFEVVTSFETLQHVDEDRRLVAELRRVLAPGGSLLLSTPNALHSRPAIDGHAADRFHTYEYEPDELRALLSQLFGCVTLLGQVTKSYYPVSPFWEDPRTPPASARARVRTWAWRVENRLPFAIKDGMSRLLHNRAFFPGEFDFDFLAEHVERGHVTVAVCEP